MSAIVEPFPLALLGRIARSMEVAPAPVKFVGLHSCVPLSLYLAQHTHSRLTQNPHVVVTADMATADSLKESLQFWDPALDAHILPPFDVGIYSNLYPNQKVIAQRLRWLYQAHNAKPGEIFIAPVEAILQKTLPYSAFTKSILKLERGTSLPSNMAGVLHSLGYVSAPTVEDVGTFSFRGGIIDIFSPGHKFPLRIELFGDTVESLRSFDPETQLSIDEEASLCLLPAREVLYNDENRQQIARSLTMAAEGRNVAREELSEILRSVSQGLPFYGIDFLLPYFYGILDEPLNYFSSPVDFWIYDRVDVLRAADQLNQELKNLYHQAEAQTIRISYTDLYNTFDRLDLPPDSTPIWVEKIDILESTEAQSESSEIKSFSVNDFSSASYAAHNDSAQHAEFLKDRIGRWRAQGYRVFIATQSHSLAERLKALLERAHFQVAIVNENQYQWHQYIESQQSSLALLHLVTRELPDGFRLPDEQVIFLRDEDILGKRRVRHQTHKESAALERSEALSFGDLKPGELVVHNLHGVGVYEGLKAMEIDGAPAEFIELRYKDNDRLYLPVYRVGQLHKYSGPSSNHMIDKLGGTGWAKTKTKVRNQLRDIAAKLLSLYAKRAQTVRQQLSPPGEDFHQFENLFAYQETDDQLRAIESVLTDFSSEHPMDRLICGDVGFGKTEVAMRAAFMMVHDHKQVAIIAPTTILTHQHFVNFKKRFAKWPIEIRALNRFVSAADIKKTLADLKAGKVDIVIGTHRLLSKDIHFKNLGLLIIDEEQKFGVTHKERLRYLRESVDTLALSATPIPRTLNMSLVGIRDLSLINTPPEDRLPTRTFVCKFDPETIRKAIESEIARGGQVFFLHNRVQSIEGAAADLRKIVPTARMAIAHGQMDEDLLEKTMLKFFNHELDVLVCTAIIESGMDIPRANTIFIDNAHTFGVSQLYQLRGRVGRSKERAYCYLLIPSEKRIDATAQERLKIIQENTALGSGIRVAQYDLELRGAGDILGEDQSGHINAVGYELYMELLNEALLEQKGVPQRGDQVDPEINLRVPALLPDKYIPDVRMRLYYYKCLSSVSSIEDIDRIERELHDQFGTPPEPVMNLLGLMLIRKLCRDLGVQDISAGKNAISLLFTEKTTVPPAAIIQLTSRENKKYQLSPDQRLKVRMNEITWPKVVDELEYLLTFCR